MHSFDRDIARIRHRVLMCVVYAVIASILSLVCKISTALLWKGNSSLMINADTYSNYGNNGGSRYVISAVSDC